MEPGNESFGTALLRGCAVAFLFCIVHKTKVKGYYGESDKDGGNLIKLLITCKHVDCLPAMNSPSYTHEDSHVWSFVGS